METFNSVLLIDNNEVDSFINKRILEIYGVKKIISLKDQEEALIYLIRNNSLHHLILVDPYMAKNDVFDFIKQHQKATPNGLNKICLISALLNPEQINKAKEMNIETIEKPLTIEKISNLMP